MLRNTPGVTHITNSPKMGVPYTPASNLTDLAPPGQFLMGVKLFPGNPKKMKRFLKINLSGLFENAWLPWQPVIRFLEPYKINHISAATYHTGLRPIYVIFF